MRLILLSIIFILSSCSKENVSNYLQDEGQLNNQFDIVELNDISCPGCGRITFGSFDLLLVLNTEINDCRGSISLQNIEEIIVPKNDGIFDLNLLNRFESGNCRIEVNDLYLERDNGELFFFFIGERILLREIENN